VIIEANGLKGLTSDLAHLDEVTTKLGFVRWQWEYYRATYDLKLEDKKSEYFLRINARATEGKLESPYAVLALEEAYIGEVSFPHGLDYNTPIPDAVMKVAQQKINELQHALAE